jgi:hypothetical protein
MSPRSQPPPDLERRPPGAGRPALEIHRSARRKRSAQAYARQGVVVVRLPAGLAPAEEERLIESLLRKVTGRSRAASLGGDTALARRAAQLADDHLDGIRPRSITWSGRMARRYGSCTPADGTIRISRDVASFPAYVRDYVILHELAHLVVADHSPAFHDLLARLPDAARARGFLEGYTAGRLAAHTPGLAAPEGDATDTTASGDLPPDAAG